MEKKDNKVFDFYNYLNVKGSPEEILDHVIKSIPDSKEIGFAGIEKKQLLKKFLKGFMFDKKEDNQSYFYDSKYDENIKQIQEEIILKGRDYINKKTHIFLFPTFDKFVIEKMEGVNGFSPWKNTIWIFINFEGNWKEHLTKTIIHELAHTVSPFYNGGNFSLGYGLILDGIAEHFKDFIIPGERSPWTQAISKEKAEEIFQEIKSILNEKKFDKYNEIFYGAGKYPLWSGYTIGYYLIQNYLEENPNLDWKKLLIKNPEEILSFVIKKHKII